MYKIHVKRIKSQRVKKCRGFKRLIFKSLLISQPKYTDRDYIDLLFYLIETPYTDGSKRIGIQNELLNINKSHYYNMEFKYIMYKVLQEGYKIKYDIYYKDQNILYDVKIKDKYGRRKYLVKDSLSKNFKLYEFNKLRIPKYILGKNIRKMTNNLIK